MKKKSAFVLVLFTCILNMYSETDLYSGAPKATRTKIENANKLVKERKYQSAFTSLGKEDLNEYLIAKKTELCLNYFAQSIMHQMFAFKDLNKNEDLYELRNSKGNFQMEMFDPVKIISEFDPNNKIPILNKTLGDYYFDINLRYNSRWLISDNEVQQSAMKYYQLALEHNCFTSQSLANFAETCLYQGDYEKSVELYTRALKIDKTNPNWHYNLAIAYLNTGKFESAIKEGEIAYKGYAPNIGYQIDCLLLCADCSASIKKEAGAIEYLQTALQLSTDDYRIYKRLNAFYLALGDTKNAAHNADVLFSMFPTNPAASQIILDNYKHAKKNTELVDFFNRNILKFQGQFEALGNLYFHLAYYYFQENNQVLTTTNAKKAEENFIQANAYTDEVKNAITQFLAN